MSKRPLMVVVGGAGSIGSATLRRARSEGFATLSIDLGPQAEADDNRIADIRDEEAIARAFNSIDRPIEALVYTAGIRPFQSIEDTAWDDWTETMAVNVRGPMLCLKHGAPKLSSGTGSITLLAADSAEKASLAYRTSVGGLKGLMRATSGEFAPLGIRINAVCPVWDGMTDPATSEDIADAILFLASNDASFITGTELTIDGGRWIKP